MDSQSVQVIEVSELPIQESPATMPVASPKNARRSSYTQVSGKPPQVSQLMSGVHNLRPPLPKYSFTWDVELVLRLFKSWPSDPTPKQMTIKTATLLGLIAIPRGAELHLFDLNFMSDFYDYIILELPGTIKNVEEGAPRPDPIEFNIGMRRMKSCALFHVFVNTWP